LYILRQYGLLSDMAVVFSRPPLVLPVLAPRFRGDKFTPAKAGARKHGGGTNSSPEFIPAASIISESVC
jgi:hypothetical protein